MSDTVNDAEARIREAAENGSVPVVESILVNRESIPRAPFIPIERFSELIESLRPPILYLSAKIFDVEEEIQTEFDIEEDDPVLGDPRIKKLIQRWRHRNGVKDFLCAYFVLNGVLHEAVESADWSQDFSDDCEKVAAALGIDID